MNLALTDHHVSKICLIGRDTHSENAYQPFLVSCNKRGQTVKGCKEAAVKYELGKLIFQQLSGYV